MERSPCYNDDPTNNKRNATTAATDANSPREGKRDATVKGSFKQVKSYDDKNKQKKNSASCSKRRKHKDGDITEQGQYCASTGERRHHDAASRGEHEEEELTIRQLEAKLARLTRENEVHQAEAKAIHLRLACATLQNQLLRRQLQAVKLDGLEQNTAASWSDSSGSRGSGTGQQ